MTEIFSVGRSILNPSFQNGEALSQPENLEPSGVADSLLAKLTQELSLLEKRDRVLWLIVTLSGIIAGGGLLCVFLPKLFLDKGDIHFEISVSKQVLSASLAVLILLNTWIAIRRADLRRTRRQAVDQTIHSELIRLQSFTDPLTAVYNRRSLDEMVGRFISHARRRNEPLTFLVVDLDQFKQVNTRFGHLTGDFVLAEIGGLLRHATRGSDAVFRYGGDEFLIILANTPLRNAWTVVDRITSYLDRWDKNGYLEGFRLTASIGVAEWVDGKTLDEVFDAADQDMYLRKHCG